LDGNHRKETGFIGLENSACQDLRQIKETNVGLLIQSAGQEFITAKRVDNSLSTRKRNDFGFLFPPDGNLDFFARTDFEGFIRY
jgi:hypothetical protein